MDEVASILVGYVYRKQLEYTAYIEPTSWNCIVEMQSEHLHKMEK